MSAREWRRLRNPPIIEGLLDIQFVPLAQSCIKELENFQTLIPEYAEKHSKFSLAGEIVISDAGTSNVSHQSDLIGYQFRDEQRARVFQARLNGVTLSFLSPYTSFSELRAEAKLLWELFRDRFHPNGVTRVALRYINQLNLPLPFSDFKEYILTVPDIAPGLPQGLAAFHMRIVIPDEKTRSLAAVTEAFQGLTPDGKSAPVLFDIDVFHQVSGNLDDDSLWPLIDELRDIKNRIFFKTITPKLMEQYV